ncbi:MAG: nuclear transport factor 2 family protein [Chloroflexota bacterium]|nr:nuclear transport factor 2 family protein [Chloroflexota bacterium]
MQTTKRSGAEAVVERIRVAINGHDLEALTSCFVTDYVNETPVHPERGFRGREQVRRNWEQIFSGVADIRAEVIRVTADGDTAWSEWEMSGSRRDGSPLQMRGVAIYGVADDQAAWCRFYLEPVDEGGEDVNAATRRIVSGGSGPSE